MGEHPQLWKLMGSCCRKDDYDTDDSDFEDTVRVLNDDDIDPELLENASMPESFLEIDDDNSGLIEYPEFLKGFAIDDSPLVQKMFYVFDEDHSGNLDFYEFIKLVDKCIALLQHCWFEAADRCTTLMDLALLRRLSSTL